MDKNENYWRKIGAKLTGPHTSLQFRKSWNQNSTKLNRTKSVDALRAQICRIDLMLEGFVWNIFAFPERLVTPMSQKMPYFSNTWSYQTAVNQFQKKTRKIPNHKGDAAKRREILQMPGSKLPSGQWDTTESLARDAELVSVLGRGAFLLCCSLINQSQI